MPQKLSFSGVPDSQRREILAKKIHYNFYQENDLFKPIMTLQEPSSALEKDKDKQLEINEA